MDYDQRATSLHCYLMMSFLLLCWENYTQPRYMYKKSKASFWNSTAIRRLLSYHPAIFKEQLNLDKAHPLKRSSMYHRQQIGSHRWQKNEPFKVHQETSSLQHKTCTLSQLPDQHGLVQTKNKWNWHQFPLLATARCIQLPSALRTWGSKFMGYW